MNNLVRFYRGLTAPESPSVGMLWFDLSTFTIKVYHGGTENDGWETYGTGPEDLNALIERVITLETNVTEITTVTIPTLKSDLEKALAEEVARATAAESANAQEIKDVKEKLNYFLESEDLDSTINTLKEIQKYISEHGDKVTEIVKSISDNTEAIQKEVEDRKAAIDALDADLTATGEFVTVQAVQTDGKLTGLTLSENNIASKAVLDAVADEVRENAIVAASALNDLAARLARAENAMISKIEAGDYIQVTPGANSATISTVTGSVENGDNALAVASDVKDYLHQMMSWANGSFAS